MSDSLPAPAPPRTMSFFAAAGLTIAARLVVDVVRELADAARPGAAADIVTYAAAFAIAQLLFIFIIVRIWTPEGSLRDVLALRRPSIISMVLAFVAGCAMYPPLAKIDSIVAKRFPVSQEEQTMLEQLSDTSTTAHTIGLIVTLVFVMPICSELFFRGALFGRLRRERPEGLAVFATTAFFVLATLDPRSMASMLVLGATITWLRARTGSILPSMLGHMGFYAVACAPLLVTGEFKDDSTWSTRWVLGGAAVALVSLALALALARSSETCRQLRAQDA